MSDYREFSVDVSEESLTCMLAEPERLSDRPAILLNFATDRASSLQTAPYNITPRMFTDAGHRALSIDLPHHGERVVQGRPAGIEAFCTDWLHGSDVFTRFADDGRAVIDTLIGDGLAEPGRIFVSGTSRGGYSALRLMAADQRIAAGAAFAPVVDWRSVTEFAAVKDQPKFGHQALVRYADSFAGRGVWVAVGNRDVRIGTEYCLHFIEAVLGAEAAQGNTASRVVLHVVPDSGHSLSDHWRQNGGEYLLAMAEM